MRLDDVINEFCSRSTVLWEHAGNLGILINQGCSQSSRCSQQKIDYQFNRKISLEDLLKIHSPFIVGCKLEEILAKASPIDYEDLLCIEVLESFARMLLSNGEIQMSENQNN